MNKVLFLLLLLLLLVLYCWCGFHSVSLQSFVFRHLVTAPVRNTKKLPLKGYVAIPLQLDHVTIN